MTCGSHDAPRAGSVPGEGALATLAAAQVLPARAVA
jgi:hypothetical protein